MLLRLRGWLRALFRAGRLEQEMREEMRAHLDRAAERYERQGLREADARAAAAHEFGNVGVIQEDARDAHGVRWITDAVQDVRHGMRSLRRSPGFTMVVLITLALGIGANAAVFSIVYGVVFRPLAYPEPQRVVELTASSAGSSGEQDVSYDELRFLQQHTSAFESLAGYTVVGYNVGVGNEAGRIKGLSISSAYFQVLGIRPLLGRDLVPQDNFGEGAHVALVSYGAWQRQMGGDKAILGRTIRLDGEPFTVIGVMPPELESTFDPILPGTPDVWTPLALVARTAAQGQNVEVLGRIQQGVSFAQARAQINGLTREFRSAFPRELGPTTTLGIQAYQTMLSSDVRTMLLVLFGAVGFVLLIACVNVANLLVARATARKREFALRAALGASRGRLMRQALTESVVLSLMGALLALGLARSAMPSLVALSPSDLPRSNDIRLDGLAFAFTLAVAIITGMVFGLAPAFRAAAGDAHEMLEGGAFRVSSGRRHGRLRAAVVVGEMAMSLVLLTGAMLLIETFWRVLNTDPGVDPIHVLAVETYPSGSRYDASAALAHYYDAAMERIDALPGVHSAAVIAGGVPMQRGGNIGVALHGKDGQQSFELRMVTPRFFSTMRVPVVRGRPLAGSDNETAAPVAVINQTAASALFSGRNPIGEVLNALGADRKIVGVIGDVKSFLDQPAQPGLYIPLSQTPAQVLQLFAGYFPTNVVIRTSVDPLTLSHSIEEQLRAVDPLVGLGRVRTMEQVRSAAVAMRQFSMTLLSLFAGLALILAAVGIYGITAYNVTQRTHEIGVRVALGAAGGDVTRLVLGQGLHLTGSGIGLGVVGALALTPVLQRYLYRVHPADPIALVSTATLLGLVAMLASYIPARRATKVDPLTALRHG